MNHYDERTRYAALANVVIFCSTNLNGRWFIVLNSSGMRFNLSGYGDQTLSIFITFCDDIVLTAQKKISTERL